jgi:hypothetical protein
VEGDDAQGQARVRVAAFVPDLMDRSRIAAVAPDAAFVASAAAPAELDADVYVVDLGRPAALDVLPALAGRRVVGFGSHVDRALLDRAREAGCSDVRRRSEFFARLGDILG